MLHEENQTHNFILCPGELLWFHFITVLVPGSALRSTIKLRLRFHGVAQHCWKKAFFKIKILFRSGTPSWAASSPNWWRTRLCSRWRRPAAFCWPPGPSALSACTTRGPARTSRRPTPPTPAGSPPYRGRRRRLYSSPPPRTTIQWGEPLVDGRAVCTYTKVETDANAVHLRKFPGLSQTGAVSDQLTAVGRKSGECGGGGLNLLIPVSLLRVSPQKNGKYKYDWTEPIRYFSRYCVACSLTFTCYMTMRLVETRRIV